MAKMSQTQYLDAVKSARSEYREEMALIREDEKDIRAQRQEEPHITQNTSKGVAYTGGGIVAILALTGVVPIAWLFLAPLILYGLNKAGVFEGAQKISDLVIRNGDLENLKEQKQEAREAYNRRVADLKAGRDSGVPPVDDTSSVVKPVAQAVSEDDDDIGEQVKGLAELSFTYPRGDFSPMRKRMNISFDKDGRPTDQKYARVYDDQLTLLTEQQAAKNSAVPDVPEDQRDSQVSPNRAGRSSSTASSDASDLAFVSSVRERASPLSPLGRMGSVVDETPDAAEQGLGLETVSNDSRGNHLRRWGVPITPSSNLLDRD